MESTSSNKDFVKANVVSHLVRILVQDGRSFIGRFETVDKSGNLFIMDGLEILDTKDEDFFVHGLFKPLFHFQEKSDKLLKYVGSIIIPRKHITKIYIDKKLEQVLYQIIDQKVI